MPRVEPFPAACVEVDVLKSTGSLLFKWMNVQRASSRVIAVGCLFRLTPFHCIADLPRHSNLPDKMTGRRQPNRFGTTAAMIKTRAAVLRPRKSEHTRNRRRHDFLH